VDLTRRERWGRKPLSRCDLQQQRQRWYVITSANIAYLTPLLSPSFHSRAHTVALATPTQTTATLDGASASLVAQALQQGLQQGPQTRPGLGNREADGGWCISWCKDKYWGEIIAAGCGISGTVKVVLQVTRHLGYMLMSFPCGRLSNHRRPDAPPPSSRSIPPRRLRRPRVATQRIQALTQTRPRHCTRSPVLRGHPRVGDRTIWLPRAG
jgi:nucleoporin SEH1